MLVPDIHGEMPTAFMNGQKGPENLVARGRKCSNYLDTLYTHLSE
jgi:hypothetical protein